LDKDAGIGVVKVSLLYPPPFAGWAQGFENLPALFHNRLWRQRKNWPASQLIS